MLPLRGWSDSVERTAGLGLRLSMSRRTGSARYYPLIEFLIDDLDRAVDLGIRLAKLMRNRLHQ